MQIVVNGQPKTLPDGASVADLVIELRLAQAAVAVEVNRELVPRRAHGEHKLRPDDRVEVVTLVGGG
jgi:thiamine biosynthesis protein ThiS